MRRTTIALLLLLLQTSLLAAPVQRSTASTPVAPATTGDWIEVVPTDGNVYYYHRVTREARWINPEASEPSAPPQPPPPLPSVQMSKPSRRLLAARLPVGTSCPSTQSVMDCFFRVVDTNRDAHVSRQELIRAMESRVPNFVGIKAIMVDCDANRDNVLTRQDALDKSDTCLASCHDRQVAFDLFGCDSILSVEL